MPARAPAWRNRVNVLARSLSTSQRLTRSHWRPARTRQAVQGNHQRRTCLPIQQAQGQDEFIQTGMDAFERIQALGCGVPTPPLKDRLAQGFLHLSFWQGSDRMGQEFKTIRSICALRPYNLEKREDAQQFYFARLSG